MMTPNAPDAPLIPGDPALVRAQYAVRVLRLYHRHRVLNAEGLPGGRFLLAVNHSLATYDVGMLGEAVYQATGRIPRMLGDRALFSGPDKGRIIDLLGAIEATPENCAAVLGSGQIAVVAPGGMREALRPSEERFTIRWDRRKGFVRLAMKTGSPIVLAACPDADLLYTVYDNQLTKLVYKLARLPLPIIRGAGLSLLPRPVPLTHLLSEPLHPPSADPDDDDAVDAWHAQVVERMNALMDEAHRLPREGFRGGWRPSSMGWREP